MDLVQQFLSPAVWAGAILALILQHVVKHAPAGMRSIIRGSRLRELRSIKIMRHYQDQVTFQLMKANSYFLIFAGVCALYFLLFSIGPLAQLNKFPLWISIIAMSPIFIVEILWLNQSSLAKELIKSRYKLTCSLSRKKGTDLFSNLNR
jgi:hypothetical protein